MAWNEITNRRILTGRHYQDDQTGVCRFVHFGKTRLHYGADLAETVNLLPVRVNNDQLDGWIINANNWHYALGIPKIDHPGEDGWVGFRARGGEHWFKFRLLRAAYLHWPTKDISWLGNTAAYNRANLTAETESLEMPDGSSVNVLSRASWGSVFPGVSVEWAAEGRRLKEEIFISQATREGLPNPTTPANETYFGFVFRVDASDIPRYVIDGVLQSIDEMDDSGGEIELRDAVDELLAFMPIDYAWSENDPETTVRLRKRLWRHTDGNYYLLVGALASELGALPAGGVYFDPTFTDGYGGDEDTAFDTHVRYNQADTAYGTYTVIRIQSIVGAFQGLIKFTLSDLVGATINDADLYLYYTYVGTDNNYDTIGFARILSANSGWIEACTFNYADGAGASDRWAGDSGNDGGADAGCSVSGTDFSSTDLATLAPGTISWSAGDEVIIDLDETEFASMVNANYGLVIYRKVAGTNYVDLCSSDNATTGYRPKLVVDYTAGTDITVPVGSLAITGYAPTVTVSANQNITVPVGSLAITGYAPTVTVSANQNITVPVGSLAITGYAPTVTATSTTRFYLPSSGSAAVSPAYDSGWENTGSAARLACVTTKITSTMTTVNFSDADASDQDCLLRQYVSDQIAAQTLSAQTVKFQIRASETETGNNMFTAICIRVVNGAGDTVRGTALALTRDATELATSLTNRQFSATSSEVVASDGDRIVIEIGAGGDPSPATKTHSYSISIGDDSGTDLGENDTDTAAYNPWVEFANSITFQSGANINITVPAGSLVITGYAPTVTASDHQNITVPAGSLVITGYAPTVTASDHQDVEVPAGSLAITGYAPTVTISNNQNIAVPAGSLAITGYAPTVETTANINITVPAGVLAITGYAPTVAISDHQNITVPAGTLAITGYAPDVQGGAGLTINVPAGVLALTGYAPTVTTTADVDITVPAGTLTITGYAPTVGISGNVDITVPAGSLAITGYAPAVTTTADVDITVPAGVLTITGYAPTVTASDNQEITVPAGSLTIAGYAPTITATANINITVPLGSLAITGYAPTVTASDHQEITVPAGSLVITGYAPTITAILIVAPSGRTYEIDAESRLYEIDAESRLYEIYAESRLYEIDAEV